MFDPSDPIIDEDQFKREDWTCSEYGHDEGEETLPSNMSTSRGLGFVMRAKVDTDRARDTVTRRSRTGFWYGLIVRWFIGFRKNRIVWGVVLMVVSSSQLNNAVNTSLALDTN